MEEVEGVVEGVEVVVSLVVGEGLGPPPLGLVQVGQPSLDGLAEDVVGQVIADA
ncbi:hypothetical protein [Streptomyces sp. NPDC003247]|uniref:hypothetical protein n=1 Tax=Streptomyces sp. NPDC003247 TaxID=3364677 RepID=UPI0036B3E2E0